MLIEIHALQNHSAANLNRDDLGAPKTCYFGGVLRSRISSQCLKRSIRLSPEFAKLLGGVRTRRLPTLIAYKAQNPDKTIREILDLMRKRELEPLTPASAKLETQAQTILQECGFLPKAKRGKQAEGEEDEASADAANAPSKMLVYTTEQSIAELVALLQSGKPSPRDFARLIANETVAPDMALSGRMLEPDKAAGKVWETLHTTVDAALQVAHAFSTHEARPEVDYFTAADDVPGSDAGAAHVNEAMYASACFYKYFSINWEELCRNLKAFGDRHDLLAAHTVGAFLRAAALATPTGKRNAYAHNNPPDAMMVEVRNTPISYANAFARPVDGEQRDLISQSVAQLAHYAHAMDEGYGGPTQRFWFSPGLLYPPVYSVRDPEKKKDVERSLQTTREPVGSLQELVSEVIKEVGYDWEEVQKVALHPEVP